MKCTDCGTESTKQWRGKGTPNVVCQNCYMRTYMKKQRAKERATEKKKETLSQARLRDEFDYNPETGIATWKTPHPRNIPRIGKAIGPTQSKHYSRIRIDKITIQLHQAIWCWMTGEWPKLQIDHINRNRADNRWSNLRLAEPWQNMANKERRRDSTKRPYRGVKADGGGYTASIGHKYEKIYLGRFSCPIAAAKTYDKLARLLKGEFALTNFSLALANVNNNQGEIDEES